MKDEKLINREEIEQDAKETQSSKLSSENLDMSELEVVEGGNLDTGCSALFSGSCSGGSTSLKDHKGK